MLVRYRSAENCLDVILIREVTALAVQAERLGPGEVVYKIIDEGRRAARELCYDTVLALITNGKEYEDNISFEVESSADVLAYADSEAAASHILSEFYKAVALGGQTFDLLQYDKQ